MQTARPAWIPVTERLKVGLTTVTGFAWIVASAALITMLLWRLSLDHYDQALFRIGARVLADGGWLYKDFWDLKQPGIYWFYKMSGIVFGEGGGERGYLVREVLLLNSVWLVATTGICAAILRRVFVNSRVWLLVPLIVLLTFVLRIDTYSIAQVESLIMLPLLWITFCLIKASDARVEDRRLLWCALAGLGVLAVAVAKLILLPVAIGLVIVGVWFLPRIAIASEAYRVAPLLVVGGVAALGMGLIWAAFGMVGLSHEFWWAQWVFPQRAVSTLQSQPTSKFFASALHLGSFGIFFVPLALLGIKRLLRSGQRRERMFLWSFAAWFGIGFCVIAPQSLSWHAYHFIVLLWPLGMLACAGLAAPVASVAQGSVWRSVAVAVLVAGTLVNATRWLIRPVVPDNTIAVIDSYQADMPELMNRIGKSTCRSALIFGTPALFHAGQLKPATTLSGQLAPIMLPMQWDSLLADTMRSKPRFVYLDNAALTERLNRQGSQLAQWFAQNYKRLQEDKLGGTWLLLAQAAPDGPCVMAGG